MQRKKIKIELIETNEGQILGVPKNPRYIKDAEFEKLKQSIKDFPEMLEIREVVVFPLNGRYIALGGNMRFLGCKDLGYKEIDCVILPAEMPVEKLREFAIKDNGNFGAWDFDMLANEWDLELLDMANVAIPNFSKDVDYGILDDADVDGQLSDMTNGVKKAIQIEFNSTDYEEAHLLVKFWREQKAYVGGMIIEYLKSKKDLL